MTGYEGPRLLLQTDDPSIHAHTQPFQRPSVVVLFPSFQGFVIKRVGSTQESAAFLLSLSLQVSAVSTLPNPLDLLMLSLEARRASEHLVLPLSRLLYFQATAPRAPRR